MINSFMGGKAKVRDFMPSYKEDKKEQRSSLASKVLSIFGGKG